MKLALKIDKTRTLIKNNGLRKSVKILFGYGKKFGKSFFVKKGDILFIASGVGDSAHYRTENVAEELCEHGFHASVTLVDNPRLEKIVDQFRIFIFHKTICTEKIARVIEKIKAQNKTIIFDTDDLNFDEKYISQMDYYKNAGEKERVHLRKGLGKEILEDNYVEVATTTTTYLAKILKDKGKRVFVVSNKISDEELEIVENILSTKKRVDDGFIYLGYFSGTPSHNKDFAEIIDALVFVMQKYVQVKLILAGPLEKGNKLDEFRERIISLPLVPRGEHYKNIFKADINLVPLEKDMSFCEAKSELKFFEAGILKIPTVAINNDTFSNAIEDGVTGFLANDTKEWIEKISRLIEDESLRKKIGEKAREKTLADYTNKNSHSEDYYEYLRGKLGE